MNFLKLLKKDPVKTVRPTFAPTSAKGIFSAQEEAGYKIERVRQFKAELYSLECEQAFSVSLIFSNHADERIHLARLQELEAELPQGDNKLSKSARSEYTRISQEIAGVNFLLNSTRQKLAKLYDQVALKSDMVRALRKNILFTESLSLSEVPQLPYFEINKTKYAARENAPVKDDKGVMELYVEKNRA